MSMPWVRSMFFVHDNAWCELLRLHADCTLVVHSSVLCSVVYVLRTLPAEDLVLVMGTHTLHYTILDMDTDMNHFSVGLDVSHPTKARTGWGEVEKRSGRLLPCQDPRAGLLLLNAPRFQCTVSWQGSIQSLAPNNPDPLRLQSARHSAVARGDTYTTLRREAKSKI